MKFINLFTNDDNICDLDFQNSVAFDTPGEKTPPRKQRSGAKSKSEPIISTLHLFPVANPSGTRLQPLPLVSLLRCALFHKHHGSGLTRASTFFPLAPKSRHRQQATKTMAMRSLRTTGHSYPKKEVDDMELFYHGKKCVIDGRVGDTQWAHMLDAASPTSNDCVRQTLIGAL